MCNQKILIPTVIKRKITLDLLIFLYVDVIFYKCFRYFFCISTPARYLVIICMSVISTIVMGFSYSTLDLLFFAYCFYIQAMLRHLQYILTNVDNLIDRSKIFSNVNPALNKCVYFHNEIINYMERIHKLFSPIIFLQFIDSFAILCTVIFQSTVKQTSIWEAWKFFIFFMGGCGQLFIFTCLGTMVSLEFDRVGIVAYSCEWYSYQKSSRKKICLIIQRSQKEFMFLGMLIFKNNLEQFLSVK